MTTHKHVSFTWNGFPIHRALARIPAIRRLPPPDFTPPLVDRRANTTLGSMGVGQQGPSE